MTEYTITQAVNAVRTSIDELQLNSSLMININDEDNSDLNSIIRDKLVEAVTMVHKNAQHENVLQDAEEFTPSVTNTIISGKKVAMTINETLMRLVALKMTDSDMVLTNVFIEGAPEAAMQKDANLCGNYEKPAAVYDAGKITYYSLSPATISATYSIVEYLRFLPYPTMKERTVDGETVKYVEICSQLQLAIEAYLVGLVLVVFKDNSAETYFNLAKGLM